MNNSVINKFPDGKSAAPLQRQRVRPDANENVSEEHDVEFDLVFAPNEIRILNLRICHVIK